MDGQIELFHMILRYKSECQHARVTTTETYHIHKYTVFMTTHWLVLQSSRHFCSQKREWGVFAQAYLAH